MNNLYLRNFIKYYYIRKSNIYKRTLSSLLSNRINEDLIIEMLQYAINNVPYYRNRYKSKPSIRYSDLPILRKKDIINCETELLSDKYNPKFLSKKSTGGTSGISLNIYRSIRDAKMETAFVDYAFSLIDSPKNLKIGILRGNKPKKGLFEKQFDQYIMSSYDLSSSNIKKYIHYIEKNGINCLSVYPTAITIFCKHLKYIKNEIRLPELKGILSSSEILSEDSKQLIKEVFPKAKLIDLYGQNEHIAFALSVDGGHYKFYKQYGYTEFIDTGQILPNGNKICEIVSTGFLNKAMPLLRYGTDDYVELNEANEIVSIIGRTQDFLVNTENELVPCMVLTRDKTLENVINFQYYQDTVGDVIFRVVVNNHFSEVDEKMILQDIENTFAGKIRGFVSVVESIEKTKAGKQKRLIQML